MKRVELILASASPRRRELLAKLTPDFTVCAAAFDEHSVHADTPAALAALLAQGKCRAVARTHPDAAVIGCDTVVDVDGAVFGKPADAADAARMLRALSGRRHAVHTGVCVSCGGQETAFTETTRVQFAALSEDEIAAYLATGDAFDKAGAYGIQNGACRFVTAIEGCYFNVMGLPVAHLYAVLRSRGLLIIPTVDLSRNS